MSENRLIKTTEYPTLGMVEVDTRTFNVTKSSGTTMTADDHHMIHFSIETMLESMENVQRVILRFRQGNVNNDNVYLRLSTDKFFNSNEISYMDLVEEDNITYREVDLTDYFTCESKLRYFSILCSSSLILYTSAASTGYCPKLIFEKIKKSDFIPNQAELTGSVGEDRYKVNLCSGKLYYDKHLISVKTKGSMMNLSMSYKMESRNSNTIKTGFETGLGKGFKFNYQQLIYQSGTNYIYIDEQYKLHTFKLADNLNGSGSHIYYDINGGYLVLEKLTSGYKITQGFQVLEFDNNGRLTKNLLKKANSHVYVEEIEYDSSNRITKIKSGVDSIQIQYDDNNVTIIGSDSQTVSINSDGGLITSVVNSNGLVTEYQYKTQNGILLSSDNARIIPSLSFSTLNSVMEANNKLFIVYYDSYKVAELKKYYNDKLLESKEINYKSIETQVLSYKYNGSSTTKLQEIDMRYRHNKSGQLELLYEMINNKICGIKYYKYDYNDDIETVDFNNTFFEIENVSLRGYSTYGDSSDDTEFHIESSGDYLINVVGEITQTLSFNKLVDYQVRVDVYRNVDKIGEIVYDLNYSFKQPKWTEVHAEAGDIIYLVFVNTSGAHTVAFSQIMLTPKRTRNQISCTNVGVGTGIAVLDGVKLYKNNITNFEYIDENGSSSLITDIKMTKNDIAENQRLASLSNTFNLWYNNGKNMLYNVRDVKVPPSLLLQENQTQLDIRDVVNVVLNKVILKDSRHNDVKGFTYNRISYNAGKCELYTLNQYEMYPYSTTTKLTNYDEYNKLLKETVKGENGVPSTDFVKEYTYDARGNIIKIKTISSNHSIEENYTYNDYDELVGVSNQNGTESYVYNSKGNLLTIKNSNNQVIKNITYKPDLETITSVGASVGDLLLNISYEYDEYLREIEHSSANSTFEYTYDEYGRLSSILKNSIPILSYSYLIEDEKTTIEVTNELTKNEAANIAEKTKYVYDKYGNLSEKYESDISYITYGCWDSQGQDSYCSILRSKNIVKGEDSIHINYNSDFYGTLYTTERNYNADGFYEVSYTDNSGLIVDEEYREVIQFQTMNRRITEKNITEKVMIYNLVNNAHKQFNHFTYIDDEQKYLDQLNQDDLGRISNKFTYIDTSRFERDYEYKTSGSNTTNLISKEVFSIGQNNLLDSTQISETSYEYTNGLVTKVIKGQHVTEYQYDILGRLIREINSDLNIDKTYSYDVEGNIYRSDASYAYSGQVLTSYNNKSLEYTNGYLTRYGDDVLEFAYGRLIRYNNNVYKYDCEGRRLEKVLPTETHKYHYDKNGRLFREIIKSGSNTKEIEYIYGVNGMIGFIYNNQSYYYLRNMFGDVEGIYNSAGTLVASYEYDAWGKIHNLSSLPEIGKLNPIRYRGYYYDDETGLFMVGHRYYNPEWGRWLSPDDIEYLDPHSINGLNLYAYCNNDPVNKYDPTGHFAISALIIGAIVGAAIGFGTSYAIDVVTEMQDGFDWSDFNTFEDNWQKYLCAAVGGAVSGAFGAVGGAGWAFVGEFAGSMIESAYTFTSSANVGNAIWTSLLSASLGGIFEISANKLTKAYFNNSVSWLSKNAQKQITRYLNKGTEITNVHALKLLKKTSLFNDLLTTGFKGLNQFLSYGL